MVKKRETKVRGVHTTREAAERMAMLRRDNVKRHAAHAARSNLREQQLTKQRVTQYQYELNTLHEASIRGSGLDAVRMNRMNALKDLIGRL
jgi:hypothetical protein